MTERSCGFESRRGQLTEQEQSSAAAPAPPRKRRRRWLIALGVVVALLIGSELVLRFYFELGDPPLFIADGEIEYMYKPSSTFHRMGRTMHVNAFGMRSEDFSTHKSDAGELRVMVIGDSVINGGMPTDDREVCTNILQQNLRDATHRPVVVGNISAASWGPINMLAYVKRFGVFDADVVVIVLSTHDYGDVEEKPSNPVGVHPRWPSTRPVLALQDAMTRFGIPYVRHWLKLDKAESAVIDAPPTEADIERSMRALRELIGMAKKSGAKVILMQHLESAEQGQAERTGHSLIRQVATDSGIEVVQLGPEFKMAMDQGQNPYRDTIHPNTIGQGIIGQALTREVSRLLAAPATTRAAGISAAIAR
jgi:hypothetical protein